MSEPNVEVGLMFRRVRRRRCRRRPSGEQQPEVLIRLTREFYMKEEAVAVEPVAGGRAGRAGCRDRRDAARAHHRHRHRAEAASCQHTPATRSTPEPRSPARQGPYADLLARLDLDPPVYAPPVAWAPPPKDSYAEIEPNSSFGSANPVNVNTAVDLSASSSRAMATTSISAPAPRASFPSTPATSRRRSTSSSAC